MVRLLLLRGLDRLELISEVLVGGVQLDGLLDVGESLIKILKLRVGLGTQVVALGVLVIDVGHLGALVDGHFIVTQLVGGHRTVEQAGLPQVLVLLLFVFKLDNQVDGFRVVGSRFREVLSLEELVSSLFGGLSLSKKLGISLAIPGSFLALPDLDQLDLEDQTSIGRDRGTSP